jgi:hypothetical protein
MKSNNLLPKKFYNLRIIVSNNFINNEDEDECISTRLKTLSIATGQEHIQKQKKEKQKIISKRKIFSSNFEQNKKIK